MKRSLKLRASYDEAQARQKLSDTDIDIIRLLETQLLSGDPLAIERESLRETVRKNKQVK